MDREHSLRSEQAFRHRLLVVEEGLWGFAIADADGYVLVFYQLRDKSG